MRREAGGAGMTEKQSNIDAGTVESFGDEWSRFDQSDLTGPEWDQIFQTYFGIFPWTLVGPGSEGFDMGCGSGRWARGVAPRVGRLHCIDPSAQALGTARRNLEACRNVDFHQASVDAPTLPPASQDFGYSLGVLHHIPNTAAALQSCVRLLKPGAPMLVYLYYRFDNRPAWFVMIWKLSEIFRATVNRLPAAAKSKVTDAIAALVYWPLARLAAALSALGVNPAALPLSYYRNKSFYTMRTDSRDRFGTPLEQRFTKAEIIAMMTSAGLRDIVVSPSEPYWVACGIKA